MSNRFPAPIVDALLDKLSSDDAFRAQFQADPRAALKQLGYETPADKVGVAGEDPVMCCQVKQLAPKQQIAQTREAMRERFLIQDFFMFFESR